jgi:Ca-activated chloride channel family protein
MQAHGVSFQHRCVASCTKIVRELSGLPPLCRQIRRALQREEHDMSNVEMNIRLERPIVPCGRRSDIDIAIEVGCAKPVNALVRDQVLNLCLAIDCSGSMEGAKIATAIECATRLASQLGDADCLTVVKFSNDATVVYNPDLPREQAAAKIDQLEANGSTDLSAGYRLGLLEVQSHGRTGYLNRVVLITDGQATSGETKSSVLAAEARRASEMSISTTCIGIGDDFAHEILYEMASESAGNFYWVQQDQLDTVIEHESGRALSTLVVNAILHLELPPGITLLGQSNKLRIVQPLSYRLPPIEAGARTCYAYRFRVASPAADDRFPIRARITAQGRELAAGMVTLCVGTDQEYIDSPVDDAVILAREQFRLASEEERMVQLVDAGDIDELGVRVRGVRRSMSQARIRMDDRSSAPMDAELGELGVLEELIDALSKLRGASGDPPLEEWIALDAMPKLQKLMRQRANKHDRRGMGFGIDDASLQRALYDLRQSLVLRLQMALDRQPTNVLFAQMLGQFESLHRS